VAGVDAALQKALSSQDDLIARREHCSVDARLLDALGVAVGQQVRIQRTPTELALFTISERRDEDQGNVVRAGLRGRRRLGTDDEFPAVVSTPAAEPTVPDDVAEQRGEFVERLDDDGEHSALIVLAPHGGDIEPHTDEQAGRVVTRLTDFGVSAWRCKGWRARRADGTGGAFECWHITSTDLAPASFPGLASVIDRGFVHAVAFHGFDEAEVLIGGSAPAAFKERIRSAIARALAGSDICVRVATPDDRYGGDDERNIVNRLARSGVGGVQLEQSLPARRDHGIAIADAVASVYRRALRPRWQSLPLDVAERVGDAVQRAIERARLRTRRGGDLETG
jgi:phage replication-related protein YjqB (UPF0714/DUF867 family)